MRKWPEQHKKSEQAIQSLLRRGVREVIRTPGLPLRRRSLYPAELRRHDIFAKAPAFCRAPFYYTGTKEKKQVRCGLLGRRDTAKAARGIPGGFGCDEEGDCAFPARRGAAACRRAYRRTPTWRRFPLWGRRRRLQAASHSCCTAPVRSLRGPCTVLCTASAQSLHSFRAASARSLHSFCAVSAQLPRGFRAVSARLLCSFCRAFAPFSPCAQGARPRGVMAQ